MSGVFNDVSGAVHGVESWVEQQWSMRIVQVSVYAGFVFFILSSYDLISWVEKIAKDVLGFKLGSDGTRVLHAIIFTGFMYLGSRFLLDPLVTSLHLRGGNGGVEGAEDYEEGEEEVVPQ